MSTRSDSTLGWLYGLDRLGRAVDAGRLSRYRLGTVDNKPLDLGRSQRIERGDDRSGEQKGAE